MGRRLKRYRVLDLRAIEVANGTAMELAEFFGNESMKTRVSRYAFGASLYQKKYLIIEENDQRDPVELISKLRHKRTKTKRKGHEKMLIFEAKEQIDNRLKMKPEYFEAVQEYFEALEIASKCIQKQMDLIDALNDWDIEKEIRRGDTYSAKLCHDIVRQFSIYAEE